MTERNAWWVLAAEPTKSSHDIEVVVLFALLNSQIRHRQQAMDIRLL